MLLSNITLNKITTQFWVCLPLGGVEGEVWWGVKKGSFMEWGHHPVVTPSVAFCPSKGAPKIWTSSEKHTGDFDRNLSKNLKLWYFCKRWEWLEMSRNGQEFIKCQKTSKHCQRIDST